MSDERLTPSDADIPLTAEEEIMAALGTLEVWWRCRCHDTLLSECPNRDKIAATLDATRAAPPEGTKLVLVSDGLFEALGADRVEWGEPDEHGWYTPTLYRDDTWRDHIPSGYEDMTGYGQVSCSCGWDSSGKVDWEQHIDAVAVT